MSHIPVSSPEAVGSWQLGPDPAAQGPPTDDARHGNDWYNQSFGDYVVSEQPLYTKRAVRIVCVGAGATGLQLAYKAERLLQNVAVQIYEKNSDVGGTWLENRYPGCTCDIPSHSYQFPWARNPGWSQYYAGSAEIWQYFKDIATTFGLARYIQFEHTVTAARWHEDDGVWELSIARADGSTVTDRCEILVNGTGVLNAWKYPDIPGLDAFKGKLMHTARWDDAYDLAGKTVAVIGGGSSAVQVIPSIQKTAKKLIPFLRSPTWIIMGFAAKYAGPGGTNFAYTPEQIQAFRDDPAAYDAYCRELDGELNKRFTLNHVRSRDQADARAAMAAHMAAQLGHDETLTRHLIPDFALGCRRMTPGPGYLASLTQDNVQVVTEDVAKLTDTGVVDSQGREHAVDVVVCATGFAVSFAPPFACYGRSGQDLHAKFGDAPPQGYLSVMTDDFPNLFLFLGPNGPASHSSLLPILEWHTRYLFQMVEKLQRENIKAFAPKAACVAEFGQHTHTLMKRLVWSAACRSWFKGGQAQGPVTAIWPGSRLHYFEALATPRYEDFEIAYWSANRFQYLGNGYTHEEMKPDGNAVWYFDDPFCKV